MTDTSGMRAAKGTVWLSIQGVYGNVVVLIYFMIVTRTILDLSQMGIITYITMVDQLVVIVLSFQIPRASVFLIARTKVTSSESELAAIFRKLIRVGVICAFLAGSALLLLGPSISHIGLGSSNASLYIQFLSFDVAGVILSQFIIEALLGVQKYKEVGTIAIISKSIKYSVAIVLFLWSGDIMGIVLGWAIGEWFGVAISWKVSRQVFKATPAKNVPLQGITRFSLQLLGTRFLEYLTQSTERFLLLVLSGSALLGLYSPVATAAIMIAIIPTMMTSALYPYFAQSKIMGENQSIKIDLILSKWLFITYLPITFGIAALSSSVIGILAGEMYIQGTFALTVNVIAVGVTCPSAWTNARLLGQGRGKPLIYAGVISVLAGLISASYLIPQFGITGAALTHAIILGVHLIITLTAIRLSGGIYMNPTAYLQPLAASSIMFILVVLIQSIGQLPVFIPIYIIIGVLTYLACLRIMATITSYDIKLLNQFLPEKLKPISWTIERLLVKEKAVNE